MTDSKYTPPAGKHPSASYSAGGTQFLTDFFESGPADVLSDVPVTLTQVGRLVNLHLEGTLGTGGNVGAVLEATVKIPAEFRPSSDHVFSCHISNGGTTASGFLLVETDGTISVTAEGNFSGANSGFDSVSVWYAL